MRHNTIDVRPWGAIAASIVGAPIACAKCQKPGQIVSAALEAQKGKRAGRDEAEGRPTRLMVEALFPCCGYQTIYFQRRTSPPCFESKTFEADAFGVRESRMN